MRGSTEGGELTSSGTPHMLQSFSPTSVIGTPTAFFVAEYVEGSVPGEIVYFVSETGDKQGLPTRQRLTRYMGTRADLGEQRPTLSGGVSLVSDIAPSYSMPLAGQVSFAIKFSMASPNASGLPTGRVIIAMSNEGTSRFADNHLAERWRERWQKMEAALTPLYAGQYVAIWGESVVDHDKDFQALRNRVYKRYGRVPIHMPRVNP